MLIYAYVTIQYKEQLLNECKGLKSKHNINE